MNLPVRVVHVTAKRVGEGRLMDISLGGAHLLCPWELSIGARIQIRLLNESASSHESVMDASVVRCSGCAIAIEWLEFAPLDAIDLVRSESARRPPPSPMAVAAG